jgi:flagellar hook-associated protein 3 FlgL
MLDRVATMSLGQTLTSEYGRIQGRTLLTQEQIATGKVGDQYADAKDKAGVLAAAKMKAAGVDAYTAATKEVLNKLNIQDLHLQQLSDVTARLRAAIGDALAAGRAPALSTDLKNMYAEVVTLLNTRIDGKFIYGGSRTDQPPVNADTLAELVAAPTVADIFDNTDLTQTHRIDDHEILETGLTASGIATDLMQMFKTIATFDAGAGGPFGMDMTDAQKTFLTTQHVALPDIQTGINTVAAINGTRHEQATTALDRHEGMAAYFAKFVGDIEDVDLAEAVARLNADQVAAEAAGRMIAQLNQVSLLNFIPIG